MGNGLNDAPLAIFTTLAPMGAASFIILTFVFLKSELRETEIRSIDKWTALPIVVLILGFVGAFMHLANPLGALNVFAGVGSSPLSNEVLAGVVFVLLACIYWVLAGAGKLSRAKRLLLLIILSVVSLVFASFCGLAYMVYTIPTWDTPFTVIQMIGFALVGGTILGTSMLRFAQVNISKSMRISAVLLSALGLVIAAVGYGLAIVGLTSIHNIWTNASDLVPAIKWMLGAFVCYGIVSIVMVYMLNKKSFSPSYMVVACVFVAVGIFIARIGFYGLFMGISL